VGVQVAAEVGAHQVVPEHSVILVLAAVKQLILTATQSLGQVVIQQEFTGAYLDLFNS